MRVRVRVRLVLAISSYPKSHLKLSQAILSGLPFSYTVVRVQFAKPLAQEMSSLYLGRGGAHS